MKPQDEYAPLFPLLADYWEKPFSKLPKALQARVSTKEPKLDKTRVIGHAVKKNANGQIVGDDKRFPSYEEIYATKWVGHFIVDWDKLSPEQRQVHVRQNDYKNDPALAGQRHIDWHDASMDARRWWDMQNVTPKEAAMVLCRLNPHEKYDCENIERIYVDDDKTSPHRYKLLLRRFEDVASTTSKHRTLMEWRTIAQQHNLRYHSWIDDYADAIAALAGKKAAPENAKAATMNTNWILRVQGEAHRHWEEMAKISSPTKYNIKDYLAKWCNDNGVTSEYGVKLTADYIYRFALTPWTDPTGRIPKKRKRTS